MTFWLRKQLPMQPKQSIGIDIARERKKATGPAGASTRYLSRSRACRSRRRTAIGGMLTPTQTTETASTANGSWNMHCRLQVDGLFPLLSALHDGARGRRTIQAAAAVCAQLSCCVGACVRATRRPEVPCRRGRASGYSHVAPRAGRCIPDLSGYVLSRRLLREGRW